MLDLEGVSAATILLGLGIALGLAGLFIEYLRQKSGRRATFPWSRYQDVDTVCDLDAVATRTVGIRHAGKLYVIPPLETEQFFQVSIAMTHLASLRDKAKVTPEELMEGYAGVFRIVCPSISRKVMDGMSYPQIAALYNAIQGIIVGRENLDAEKKSPKPGEKPLTSSRSRSRPRTS